jgi:hypothetical protein
MGLWGTLKIQTVAETYRGLLNLRTSELSSSHKVKVCFQIPPHTCTCRSPFCTSSLSAAASLLPFRSQLRDCLVLGNFFDHHSLSLLTTTWTTLIMHLLPLSHLTKTRESLVYPQHPDQGLEKAPCKGICSRSSSHLSSSHLVALTAVSFQPGPNLIPFSASLFVSWCHTRKQNDMIRPKCDIFPLLRNHQFHSGINAATTICMPSHPKSSRDSWTWGCL